MSKFYFRQSEEDPNSYSVFVAGRLNVFGEPYCVLPLVTYDEAFYYCQGMNDKTRRHIRTQSHEWQIRDVPAGSGHQLV